MVLSSSNHEEAITDQQAILVQLAALEQVQGISPGGPASKQHCGQQTQQAAQKCFNSEALTWLSLLSAQTQGSSSQG